MFVPRSSLFAVLLLVLYRSQSTQGCATNFFGSGCKYMCHCHSGKCNRDGTCPDKKCKEEYFGPKCQAYDSFHNWTDDKSIDKELKDNDDSTCVEVKSVQPVYKKSFLFTYIRIIFEENVDGRAAVKNLTLIVGATHCKKIVRPWMNQADISCAQSSVIPFTRLFIGFTKPVSICSMYTSLGTDLALMSKVTASSQSKYAKNIVNGDYNHTSADSKTKCYTSDAENNPNVIIFFEQLSRVLAVHIINLNSNQATQEKLKNFVFMTFDSEDKRVQSYTDTATIAYPSYLVMMNEPYNKAKYGRLFGRQEAVELGNKVLNLCGIVIYGDVPLNSKCEVHVQCQPGLLCQNHKCMCDDVYTYYDMVTMQCEPRVTYGTSCLNKNCRESQACVNDICTCDSLFVYENITDECEPRMPIGAWCVEDHDCNLPGSVCISKECACDPVSHYQIDDICTRQKDINSACTETKECGRNSSCISGVCKCDPNAQFYSNETGICRDNCPRGKWGPYCDKDCDGSCKDKVCEPVTGDCEKESLLLIFIIVGVVGVLLLAAGLFLFQRRRGSMMRGGEEDT